MPTFQVTLPPRQGNADMGIIFFIYSKTLYHFISCNISSLLYNIRMSLNRQINM